jgi:hypothetical protein
MAPEEAAPKHILLPYNIPASLSSQERAYLDYKGCFTLPQNEICVGLLRAYFHHVHPLIPVVDAEETLKFLDSNTNEYNLLLLWAMFFVAANVSKLPYLHLYASLCLQLSQDLVPFLRVRGSCRVFLQKGDEGSIFFSRQGTRRNLRLLSFPTVFLD